MDLNHYRWIHQMMNTAAESEDWELVGVCAFALGRGCDYRACYTDPDALRVFRSGQEKFSRLKLAEEYLAARRGDA